MSQSFVDSDVPLSSFPLLSSSLLLAGSSASRISKACWNSLAAYWTQSQNTVIPSHYQYLTGFLGYKGMCRSWHVWIWSLTWHLAARYWQAPYICAEKQCFRLRDDVVVKFRLLRMLSVSTEWTHTKKIKKMTTLSSFRERRAWEALWYCEVK